tara:strand:- start:790 stop:963 length:174 start_codon:yes stop_codon:yes gene_type:complete
MSECNRCGITDTELSVKRNYENADDLFFIVYDKIICIDCDLKAASHKLDTIRRYKKL